MPAAPLAPDAPRARRRARFRVAFIAVTSAATLAGTAALLACAGEPGGPTAVADPPGAESPGSGVPGSPTPPPAPSTARIDTIFRDDFESNTLASWDDGKDSPLHEVLADAALAHGGSHVLRMTYPAGETGGWLTRWFMPGYDSLYVRYYVRFESNWTGGTKLLRVRGSRIDDRWSAFGTAGLCPDGYQWFSTGVIAWPAKGDPGPLQLYSYYPAMAREDDGKTCWGRFGTGEATYYPPLTASRGTWHKLEYWVKLNAPDASDGAQRFWLDGVLRGEWSGIAFRKTTDLRLNSIMIDGSLTGVGAPPEPVTRHLYVDDIFVATAKPPE
ncbi:MAG TPA: hypothetical protein VFW66_03325 [Gemmatimonadales bacterium]|nr:hypothetical protein [Gemmatimonadales bacterium]